jgi:hypothetical protein
VVTVKGSEKGADSVHDRPISSSEPHLVSRTIARLKRKAIEL